MQPAKPSLTAVTETLEPVPGLRLRQEKGRVVIEGKRADAALAQRLADWLKAQAW